MFPTVTRILGRDRQTVVYECRRCGTTVTPDTESCLECPSPEIARYDIQ